MLWPDHGTAGSWGPRCVTPEALGRELRARASSLTRLAFAEAAFPSLDQAREARLAVSEDGRTLEEVAAGAGTAVAERVAFPEELPDATRSLLFSAPPGVPLAPEEAGEAFVVRVLRSRVEPDLADPAVAARVRERLTAAHFDALVERHVSWSFDPWTVP